ncbi:MAG: hypothetical protein AB1716_10770 [Planctomycetota bacterium]
MGFGTLVIPPILSASAPPLARVELPFDPQFILFLIIAVVGGILSWLKQRKEARDKEERAARTTGAERQAGRLPPAGTVERGGKAPPLEPAARGRGAQRRSTRAEQEGRLPTLEPVDARRVPPMPVPARRGGADTGLARPPAQPSLTRPPAPTPLPSTRPPAPLPPRPARKPRTPEEIVEELRERARRRATQTAPPTPAPAVPTARAPEPAPTTPLPPPVRAVEPADLPTVTPDELVARLGDSHQLRAAILLNEILGPPVGLRDLEP